MAKTRATRPARRAPKTAVVKTKQVWEDVRDTLWLRVREGVDKFQPKVSFTDMAKARSKLEDLFKEKLEEVIGNDLSNWTKISTKALRAGELLGHLAAWTAWQDGRDRITEADLLCAKKATKEVCSAGKKDGEFHVMYIIC